MTSTPQIQQQQEAVRFHMPSLGQFKTCGLLIGLLVGFFIYLSTLGAEFVAVMLWGRDILDKTNSELVVFSLGWNLVTTCIALVVLTSLRRLVSAVFTAAMKHHSAETAEDHDDILAELLSYLEGRFAIGALVGICVSWNVTNMVLGMRPQVISSCIILAVACLWCKVTLVLLGDREERLIFDTHHSSQTAVVPKMAADIDNDKTKPLLQIV